MTDGSAENPGRGGDGEARRETIRLLLVEDNVDIAWGLAELLRARGYEVDTACDMESAVTLFRNHPPDVVLCDLNLGSGRASGYDFAQAVGEDPGRATTRLISISGYDGAAQVARAREAGFDEHIVKPASLEKLQDALRRLPRQTRGGGGHGA